MQLVRAEVEARDDPEVAAAAAQRPEQVGVRGLGHLEDVAARRDELRADELVGRESPRAHHPADAAAEGEPADAHRRRVAGAHAQPAVGEGARDAPPRRAAADPDERAVDVDVVEGREVDRETAGHGAPRAVAAGADHDFEVLVGGVSQGGAHVVDGGGAHDHGRFADAGVEAAGGVPVGIAGRDDGSGRQFVQGRHSHAVTLTVTADIRYSQPRRLNTAYRVTLVATMRPRAIG